MLTWPMVQPPKRRSPISSKTEEADILVALVAHDGVVQLADLVAAALEHLKEDVVADSTAGR